MFSFCQNTWPRSFIHFIYIACFHPSSGPEILYGRGRDATTSVRLCSMWMEIISCAIVLKWTKPKSHWQMYRSVDASISGFWLWLRMQQPASHRLPIITLCNVYKNRTLLWNIRDFHVFRYFETNHIHIRLRHFTINLNLRKPSPTSDVWSIVASIDQ